ncbi:MAG: polysaccharide biosynthesis protein [Clostridia bacterium]|nr:polysaccharide biosynthesis protein [Clostridia bacterium]
MGKQTFMKGTMILVVANGLTKVIGALFKIPLTYLLHESGMGLYNTAYQLYVLFFIIATAGLPVAVSKMVSEQLALKDGCQVRRLFRAELLLISMLGLLGSAVLYLFARPIAVAIGNEAIAPSIRAVAPALIFVAVMAGLRGFFQGTQNMTPTAVSEIIEAAGKPLVGYTLAYVLIDRGIGVASSGALAGVSAGAAVGCGVLVLWFLIKRREILPETKPRGDLIPYSRIFKQLIWIAVPITIGACVSSVTSLVDTVMVRSLLKNISFSQEEARALYDAYAVYAKKGELASLLTENRLDVNAAEFLYGAYSGYAFSLFNLPLTLITAMSISVVPALAEAFAVRNQRNIQRITGSALRITLLFALPCTIGLSVMAKPILYLLYSNTSSGTMLEILSVACVWVTLVSVSTAILQAAGKVWIPVVNMLIGAAVKVAANILLVSQQSVHILGLSISSNLCYFVIAALNLYWVMKVTKVSLKLSECLVKPLFATGAMGVGTLACYRFLEGVLPAVKLATVISIGAGCVIYLGVLLLVGGVKREDVEMLPKGEKIAALMQRYRLLR